MKPGCRNSITDVAGFQVGNAENHLVKTGVSVLMADRPFCAAVSIAGGAPGTRETDLLSPDKMVQEVDALVLSGGSAYGLDAASGVVDELRAKGRGYKVGDAVVPIVPAAILFDLLNGGNKDWQENPYPELGRQAVCNASNDFGIGTCGAGTGATSMDLKGGLGTASVMTESGYTVGALVAVNALGTAVQSDTGRFWAGMYEFDDEYGGAGCPNEADPAWEPQIQTPDTATGTNTTIGIIATDACLDKSQAKRLAVAAHDGYARSLLPSHTIFDGDLIFAASSGKIMPNDLVGTQFELGHCAAQCMARAVARAIFNARPATGDTLPTWNMLYGRP